MSSRPTNAPAFPADLLMLLIPFAVIIAMVVVGPQRLWIILAVLGAVEAAGGAAVLRGRPSSALGWLYLALGIVMVAVSTYIAVLERERTI